MVVGKMCQDYSSFDCVLLFREIGEMFCASLRSGPEMRKCQACSPYVLLVCNRMM